MAASVDLKTWIEKASAAEFADRIEAEPAILNSCDAGGGGFGVLHHAAALGRLDLIQMILERGVSVDTPSATPGEYGDAEADRPKFEPGFTPLMSAAAHGQLSTVRHLISMGADPFKTDYYRHAGDLRMATENRSWGIPGSKV